MMARSPRPGKSSRSNFRGSYEEPPQERLVLSFSTQVVNLSMSSSSTETLFSGDGSSLALVGVSSLSLAQLEAARSAFIGSASAKEISVAAAIASRLTMPLAMLLGTESTEGWSLDLVATSTQESTRSATCSDLLLVENSSHSSSIALVTGNSVMELISCETSAEISGEDADDDEGEDDEPLLLRCRRRLLCVGNDGGGDERGHQ